MKNLYLIALLTLAICSGFNASAQKRQQLASYISDSIHRSQNVFVEAGGPGLVVSINYDTRFTNTRDGLGATAGFGFLPSNGNSLFTIPMQLNYLWGSYQHYFELGAGATFMRYKNSATLSGFIPFNDDTHNRFAGTTTIGYRYQPIDGGLNFRMSFNPVFDRTHFYPYLGIGFGYTIRTGQGF